MKIAEYNQMMKYLTRPAEPEYEQLAMAGAIKGGKKVIDKLIKKGKVKKGEAPKTDVEKVKSKVESDQKNIQELANEGQIPVKDQTGPTTSDKKPGMFDDIFDKMYKDFEDTVPGEQPLTKKKRTLNAEGGRIGFKNAGFGQSEVLRQFLEDSIQSENTTFESIKDLTKQAKVDLSEKTVTKVLTEYPNKFFTDVAGTKFPLGYDDKNLSKLKEGMNLLKEWEKNPTPENWIETFQITEPSGQTKPSKFGQGLRNYLQGKKGEGNTFHKYFKKINFDDTIKKEVKTYDKKLFNKIKSSFGSAAARTSLLKTSAAVAKTVGETFLLDPENTDITDVAKALHGKKFDKASNVKKIEMLQDARNGVQKFYESLTTNRPIGLKKKIKTEQFQDILDNIESNSSDFGFKEGRIREYKMKVRDDVLKVKDPSQFFRNLRNNVEVPKGKIIDEVFSLSGTYKRAPGYLDQIQFISNKINKKKASQIDLPLQNLLTALDESKTTVVYNKKEIPIEKAIQQFNKKSRSFAKTNKIKTPQINLGGKFDPSQYKDFSPASQKNIADVFKDKNYFLTTTKTKAPSTILKSAIPVDDILKDTAKGNILFSEIVPGARYAAPLVNLTSEGIMDIAKGVGTVGQKGAFKSVGKGLLKQIPLAGLGYGIYDTGVGFKEGVSLPELGTRFFGLDPIYRYAQNQMALSPEARKIQAEINRNIAVGAEEEGGLGLMSLDSAREVTDSQKELLKTELEKAEQKRKLLNQQRGQERADFLRMIQGKIDPGATAYRSEFKAGGSGDKKKTTPTLDKPTVQIDPNAPVDPAKRDTLKGAGILGAGVALGKLGLLKLGKAAKVAKVAPLTKVVAPLGKTMTEFPEWFPTLISKVRKEGKQIPIYKEVEVPITEAEFKKLRKEKVKNVYDAHFGRTDRYKEKLIKEGVPRYTRLKQTDEIIGYKYEVKDLPDVDVVEYGGEELTVSFPNAYRRSVTMEYTPPKGNKDATFRVDDAVPESGGSPDDVPDFYAETVNNLDEVYGGASRIEQKVLKLKKPRYTQGDEVVDRAEARYDAMIDRAEDLDEF